MGILLPFPASTTTAAVPSSSPARQLGPQQRQQLALDALAGCSIADLAEQHQVSRKFVYQLTDHAHQAIADAFTPADPATEAVLFQLPVTRSWLRQFTLALVLVGHSSLRGVQEVLRDLFDFPLSLGTIHNIVQAAVPLARDLNARQDLSRIRLAALDELFQTRQPVLVGADVASTYCFLLSLEEQRDADTWAVRLLDLQQQGFAPAATIADGGKGLRAGQALALSEVPCRADVFHAERELGQLVRFLENRAYQALTTADKLQRQWARHRGSGTDDERSQRWQGAEQQAARAVALADTVAVLETWLRQDVLAVAGPPLAERLALFDFVVAELRQWEPACPHRIGPVCLHLHKQRDDLLAFAADLDRDLLSLAGYYRVPEPCLRELLRVQALPLTNASRWRRAAVLRRQLGERWGELNGAVAELAAGVVRASSVIENLNSRLRNYFFLRRQLGPEYLEVLRFFLNHRRFLRSEHPERVEQSPTELLTGQAHPHWLELLGYKRFQRVG